jgi:predicted CoA-binding protein
MKTIAVVGLSKDPTKPSHDVAAFLKSHGYRIIPVNPTIDEVLGERSYKSLLDLPDELKRTIDVVDIFRRPEEVGPIVDQAIQLHKVTGRPKAVWMQLGIVNEEAASKAKGAGLDVVMDRCMKIERSQRVGSSA